VGTAGSIITGNALSDNPRWMNVDMGKMAAPHKGHSPAKATKSSVQRGSATERYLLRLYVAGIADRSSQAIRSVTAICEEYLKDRYDLEIIDLYQRPTLTHGERILAVPTLIKKLPLPLRRVVGSMAKARVLVGLDMKPKKTPLATQ